jgi:hypothetical protein
MREFDLSFIDLVVVVLAAYRLTRFVVKDSLLGRLPSKTEPRGSGFRRALDEFAYDDRGEDRSLLRGKLGDLLTCTWCVGFWLSLVALWGWTEGGLVVQWVVVLWAVAGAQGYLSSRVNA